MAPNANSNDESLRLGVRLLRGSISTEGTNDDQWGSLGGKLEAQ